MKKERLDVLLVSRGLAESREKAKALIMAGKVLVNGEREEKAGLLVSPDKEIRIKGKKERFVSRGGYKLLKAVEEFAIFLDSKICMDIGASTGGFTDCMLQFGAAKVYSIDVGYGQLANRLRQDEKVIVLERTNVRYLSEQEVPELVDFASIDVSFISLTKIIGAVQGRLKEGAEVVCLIKPQFEAGKEKVGKNGVVREEKIHIEVIEAVIQYMKAIGFRVLGLSYSPIKGPAGNIEYLLYLKNEVTKVGDNEIVERIEKELSALSVEEKNQIMEMVKESHEMVE